MCQKCNNERTKKFDQAYDRLIEFLIEDYNYFRDVRQFSWADIYSGCEFDQRHLQRYYLKNAGCRVIDAGAERVPQELRNYLFDFEAFPEFDLILYKDYESADLFNKMGELNLLFDENQELREAGPFLNPFANFGTSNQNEEPFELGDELIGFVSVLQDGPIGGLLRWSHRQRREQSLISFNHNDVAFVRDRSEFDEASQMFLGGWDVYTDVTRTVLDLLQVHREMASHLEQKDSIKDTDLVEMTAWSLRGSHLKQKGERVTREAQDAVEQFKRYMGSK